MGIHKTKMYANCWSCGAHWIGHVLVTATGLTFSRVKEILDSLSRPTADPIAARGTLELPPGVSKLRGPHKRYLKQRGFNVESLEKLWGISGIGVDGLQYCWRIFIPIHFEGQLVSWTTRSISDTVERRYWSAAPQQERMDHKSILYGEDYCRHGVVVVEGPLDVWKIGPGAVATFGTGLRRSQVKRLAKYPVRAICFDQDAKEATCKLADQLEAFPGKTYTVALDSKDPGCATDKELQSIRKHFLE